jgi:prepilin-type N-terminal cleavage/methylation domain-containing protein/prepilin-type processing-associated H-X9-DG protein
MLRTRESRRKCYWGRSGFTLVELLVAVSIIAVLAALILTVAIRAAGKGGQVACASNLRQIAIAVQAYAYDHDGMPPRDGTRCFRPDDPRPLQTVESLKPYGATGDVWFCPADPEKGKIGAYTDDVPHWITSYYMPAAEYKVPPDIISLNATARKYWFWIAADARCIDWTQHGAGTDRRGSGSWHSGGFNLVYIDGSVKWLPLQDFLHTHIPNPYDSHRVGGA